MRNYAKDDPGIRPYRLKYKDPNWPELYNKKWREEHPKKYLIQKSKRTAKERGHEFTITEEDINIPQYCPVLGILLTIGRSPITDCDNSPSIDRFDNSKGYIKGNVNVISWRANRIKNNSTYEELKKLLNWMEANGA